MALICAGMICMQVVHEIVASASIRKYLGIAGIISFSFGNLCIDTP